MTPDELKASNPEYSLPVEEQSLVVRLRLRAAIRRVITGRTSSDLMANILDEAADEIERLL